MGSNSGETMGIQEAVELVVEHIRKTGTLQAEAVNELWSQLSRLDKSDIHQLAREGLQKRVQLALTGPYVGEVVRFRIKQDEAQQTEPLRLKIRVLEDTHYRTADDIEKPLIRFTTNDFEYCRRRNEQQILGLHRRNAAFDLGISLLSSYHAQSISELSTDIQAQFAEAWMQAAGNQAVESEPETVSV
jgi:hypothetical protein